MPLVTPTFYLRQNERGQETPGKRVYLAGNNCSFYGGWVEGAMQSGVNAAAAVLKHMALTFNDNEKVEFRDDMNALFEPNPFQEVLDELEKSSSPLRVRDRL
ncbi:MAG: FAD-dependent oxidoreductase [Cyanobacteriota bacterium]|nr:FAD-dependent oxidoreductase [Cyanobacteriota bacterium]